MFEAGDELTLWDPIDVGALRLRNRAVMPAMGTGYASRKGEVTDQLRAYLEARAEGGAGLIITEVTAVDALGKGYQRELGVYHDSFLPGLETLAKSIKAGGAAAALQLHHAGRETFEIVIGGQPVGPSAVAGKALRQMPRVLDIGEINHLVEAYAEAARRARNAGFDAVEIHGAHGYLINQFLSPYSNLRDDEYGGDATGRFRFAREIVRAVKEAAGSRYPVIFRFSSTEAVEGGYDLDYILPLLPLLEKDGVDAFHVSCGVYDSPGNPICPGIHFQPAINAERAARVKETVNVPVIVVGKIQDPRMAENILAEGKADMVAFGRQHLADPTFIEKAGEERYGDIRFCLSCNQGCIERMMFELKPVRCAINPECGEEWRGQRAPVNRGPFLIIGAGPAGLQAALTLRAAGAEVKIMEREADPGGQLKVACRPPGKEAFKGWVDWAQRRLAMFEATVELQKSAVAETMGEGGWAGIIIATGSGAVIPDIPGTTLSINLEAREVLSGFHETGNRVLIVGAGPVGMETADYLIDRGCRVTVVEARDASPVLSLTSHGYFLHKRLRENGELSLGTTVIEVNERGAEVSRRGERMQIEADSIVWAVGSRAERDLIDAVAGTGIAVRVAGDAVSPRRLIEAIHEGAGAAEELLYQDKGDEPSMKEVGE
ncbi:MAG: hypothetical protein A2W01_08040 [Candidatus Solincola sediminis]|uniref:FAD-binding protein n=1 Tax=Candidatus Solincola sediminis TaxID=1797199 RepID=A0A1F2WS65_9ACTN|nr:MAG: hypothetical protein A2Y75_04915 [Candidatus Solincola sediminis]OFW61611.1 MAG: hypothetical protein A2W01_08040 [Candidatus Solincola sediminis]